MPELTKENMAVTVIDPLRVPLYRRMWQLVLLQKRNLQNLSMLVFVNFLMAGIGFITQVKIANTLGKESFGLLAYGLAIAAYGGVIVRFGLDKTLVRDLIHYPERFGELVFASLLLRWVLFGFVVIALLGWKLAAGAGSDVSWGLLLIIIASSMMSMDLQPVYDSWNKMGRHAVYNLIQRCLYFVAIWFLILSAPGRLSIFWIGVATLGSVVLYLVIQHSWAIKRIDFSSSRQPLFRAAIRMAKGNTTIWFAAMGALSFCSLNQLILKYYCGAAELGGYAAAWQIVSIAMLLLTQISRVGNPATARITRKDSSQSGRIRFLTKYSVVMFVVAAPVGIAALVCPELIIRFLFRPEYASAASVMRIMGIYIMVFSFGLVASQYVISSKMERTYFASVIVGGILSITLCLVLIPRIAGYGAALALLIAHGVSMGLYWIAMIQHVRKQQ